MNQTKPQFKKSWAIPVAVAIGVVLLASAVVFWMVFRPVNSPDSLPEPAAYDAEPDLTDAAVVAVDLPPPASFAIEDPVPARAGTGVAEFETDFETIIRREEGARKVAEKLRQRARENPETALPEKTIKAIEKGEISLQ